VVCQTAHRREFFGERDCAACRWTDSFIDVKAAEFRRQRIENALLRYSATVLMRSTC
jgi:hypothetical protein